MFHTLKLLKTLLPGTLFRWSVGHQPTCVVLDSEQINTCWVDEYKKYKDGNYWFCYLYNGTIDAGSVDAFVFVKD